MRHCSLDSNHDNQRSAVTKCIAPFGNLAPSLLLLHQVVCLQSLPHRVGGFGAVMDWSTVLSLGEQQRLAIARVILLRPTFVILDEATSALDEPNEARVVPVSPVHELSGTLVPKDSLHVHTMALLGRNQCAFSVHAYVVSRF